MPIHKSRNFSETRNTKQGKTEREKKKQVERENERKKATSTNVPNVIYKQKFDLLPTYY